MSASGTDVFVVIWTARKLRFELGYCEAFQLTGKGYRLLGAFRRGELGGLRFRDPWSVGPLLPETCEFISHHEEPWMRISREDALAVAGLCAAFEFAFDPNGFRRGNL